MLRTVVGQCLSLAMSAVEQGRHDARGGTLSSRTGQRVGPLAGYPRLQAVLEKAEMDGILSVRKRAVGR